MQPLKALWDKQQLAIVEATGSPDSSRSHFDAQDFMESGTPGKTNGRRLAESRSAARRPGDVRRCGPSRWESRCRARFAASGAIAVGDAQQFNMGNQDAASHSGKHVLRFADAQWRRTGKDAFEP